MALPRPNEHTELNRMIQEADTTTLQAKIKDYIQSSDKAPNTIQTLATLIKNTLPDAFIARNGSGQSILTQALYHAIEVATPSHRAYQAWAVVADCIIGGLLDRRLSSHVRELLLEQHHEGETLLDKLTTLNQDKCWATLRSVVKNQISNGIIRHIEFQNALQRIKTKPPRELKRYQFENEDTMQQTEEKWARNVCHRFFRVGKPLQRGKYAGALLHQIKRQLDEQKTPIRLDFHCKRGIILALSKLLSEKGKIPTLDFLIGTTPIKLKEDKELTRKRQRGNLFLIVNGFETMPYGKSCIETLNKIIGKTAINDQLTEREIALLTHIKNNLAQFIPITINDFNTHACLKLASEASITKHDSLYAQAKEHTDYLNGFLFLITIVEPIRRLYRDENGKIYPYEDERAQVSDATPIALAQARSLSLLCDGKITLDDMFGESAEYGINKSHHRAYLGIATGRHTIHHLPVMAEKFANINNRYNLHISAEEKEKSNTLYIINGRNRMHAELKKCFGSGYESSNDSDYSDSEEDINKDIPSLHNQVDEFNSSQSSRSCSQNNTSSSNQEEIACYSNDESDVNSPTKMRRTHHE